MKNYHCLNTLQPALQISGMLSICSKNSDGQVHAVRSLMQPFRLMSDISGEAQVEAKRRQIRFHQCTKPGYFPARENILTTL